MFFNKIIIADNFPKGFESSDFQIPDGTRADFEQLGSSKAALVLKFHLLLKAKVYSIILKKYFVRNVSDFFKSLILPSRAQRAFKAGQMLIENGFLTPPIVAGGRNFLMTLEVSQSAQLKTMLVALSDEKKRKMIEQFAQTVGRMHEKGIFHGDLRLGNVLVKENNGPCHFERSPRGAESRNPLEQEKFEFYFLDNERTKKFNSIPWKLRVKNLVQVCMNRDAIGKRCQESFFKIYLAQQSKPVDSEKLLEEVDLKTTKRLEGKI